MKKFFLLPLAVALLAIPALAHQGNGPFLAVQWADAGLPTIDGDLTEWEALPDYFHVTIDDSNGPPADWGTEVDKADLDFGYWGGYNSNTDQLYAAAWAFDNIHVRDDPDGTDCACNDDSYEFFTDADHSIDDNAYGAGWWNITWPAVNGVSHAGGGGAKFTQQSGNLDYAVTFTGEEFGESTYYYEVAFTPWDALSFDGDGNDDGSVQSTLDPGETIHWEMIMTDDDAALSDRAEQYDNGRWKNDGWWSLGAGCAHSDTAPDWELDTDVFSAGGGGATAVESDTWGRLKSRF
jgi:hypothetical protein